MLLNLVKGIAFTNLCDGLCLIHISDWGTRSRNVLVKPVQVNGTVGEISVYTKSKATLKKGIEFHSISGHFRF